jgi:hypothetical protein
MTFLVNHPILTFVVTIVLLWLSFVVGTVLRKRRSDMAEDERGDYGVLLAAILTLLGLIIAFTFSMAGTRYDQRKNLEEAEANAIGTEFVRADLLPTDAAEKVRGLLRSYLDQRILFYTDTGDQLREVNATTAKLQVELWEAVKTPAGTNRGAVDALTISGMNDVLNSQGYTQAAWWNRIPTGAWFLMWAIAICCNLMIGFYLRPQDPRGVRFIMPIVIAVAFVLIALRILIPPDGASSRSTPKISSALLTPFILTKHRRWSLQLYAPSGVAFSFPSYLQKQLKSWFMAKPPAWRTKTPLLRFCD